MTPTIYHLLATYWQRMDELTVAMEKTDEEEFDTPEHDAALAAQGAVGERLCAAEISIAAFVPQHCYEATAKADFLSHLANSNHGRLEADVTKALLSSLPCLVNRRASL